MAEKTIGGEGRFYWLDGHQEGKGGVWYRAFDLVKFIEKAESQLGQKVVAIHFEPVSDNPDHLSSNIELITA